MDERVNWKIPKTCGSRERSNQGSAVEEAAVLSQVGQVVSPWSHSHLSTQAFTVVDSWGRFFASLFWGHLTPIVVPQTVPCSQPFLSEAKVVLFSSQQVDVMIGGKGM